MGHCVSFRWRDAWEHPEYGYTALDISSDAGNRPFMKPQPRCRRTSMACGAGVYAIARCGVWVATARQPGHLQFGLENASRELMRRGYLCSAPPCHTAIRLTGTPAGQRSPMRSPADLVNPD